MAVLKRILCLALALLCLAAHPAPAQDLHLYEREIKAGLLYNFLKYTDWPDGGLSGSSITVCLFGGDPFGGYLDNTKGRTVHQRAIDIRSVSRVEDTGSCNLVYVSDESRWPALSAYLAGKGVLTVGDFEGFTNRGGMIEFSRKGERVNVLMNVDAVEAAQLKIEDRLLHLGTVVHGHKGGKP